MEMVGYDSFDSHLQVKKVFEWHLSNQMVKHYSHGGGSTHQELGKYTLESTTHMWTSNILVVNTEIGGGWPIVAVQPYCQPK